MPPPGSTLAHPTGDSEASTRPISPSRQEERERLRGLLKLTTGDLRVVYPGPALALEVKVKSSARVALRSIKFVVEWRTMADEILWRRNVMAVSRDAAVDPSFRRMLTVPERASLHVLSSLWSWSGAEYHVRLNEDREDVVQQFLARGIRVAFRVEDVAAASPDAATIVVDAAVPSAMPGGPSAGAGRRLPSGNDSVRLTPLAVTASSSFSSGDGSRHYPPEDAFDGNPATAWNNGDGGPGRGQWLEVRFDGPRGVERIRMGAGFDPESGRGDAFPRNSHVKRVRILFDGGHPLVRDVGNDDRVAVFENVGVTATTVRFVFEDVWEGTRWPQLAISEITIEGGSE
jgi:hypothetical protein